MNSACGEQSGNVPHRYYTSRAGWRAMMAWYERRLASFPIPVQSHFIQTRYGCTHIVMAGQQNNPPLILLHGTNVNALGWQAQLEALSVHYWVIAPDVIGYAGKSDPVRLSYRDMGYAMWVSDVLSALNISRATLVGSSGGGFFALQSALYCPQQVAGVALINPCGIVPFRFPLNILRQPPLAYSVRFMAQHFFASQWLAKRLAQKSIAPSTIPSQQNIELAYLLLRYFVRHHPPGALPMRLLRQITAPMLLLVSAQEPFLPPNRLIKRAEQLFPHIQAYLIPNTGHDSHVEQPQLINGYLQSFLASLS